MGQHQKTYIYVLPLALKTCDESLPVTFLLGQIQKLKKTTWALSKYYWCTFHVYNECLIVIYWKVMVKIRGKKGPIFAYWFQQSMESGDASNEEPPPSNSKRKDLMQKE